MTDLKTVPTFNFPQGMPGDGGNWETPIQVSFYSGSIELEQGKDRVLIHPKFFNDLVKEINRHKKTAELALKRTVTNKIGLSN